MSEDARAYPPFRIRTRRGRWVSIAYGGLDLPPGEVEVTQSLYSGTTLRLVFRGVEIVMDEQERTVDADPSPAGLLEGPTDG